MTTTLAAILAITIAIAASLILVLISNLRRQNKTEKLLHSFNEVVAEFNLSIAKQEMLRKQIIGFDAENNKLLFLEADSNKHNGYLIDLNEIQGCTVTKEYGNLSASNVKRKIVETYVNTIGLQLDYTDGTKPIVLFFYDKATNPVVEMRFRAKQAKEWQALLSKTITKNGKKPEKREAYVGN